MLHIVKNILVIALYFYKVLIFSQNPVFENMASVSNLPDVEFYDIKTDLEHYVWLAADKGLFRYDGKSYKRFTHPSQKSNSLFQLKLDQEGKVWCNNIYGQIFYVENDCLELFFDASSIVKGQLSPYTILDNAIRLFTTTGIYDIDKRTKKVSQIFGDMCISQGAINQTSYVFAIDLENSLKDHAIYKVQGTKSVKLYTIESENWTQSPKIFAFDKHVFLTYKGAHGNNLFVINNLNDAIEELQTPHHLEDEIIYNLLRFNEDYWFLTTSGVYIYTYNKQGFTFKEQLYNTESITDVEIDFNGNYWFTTLDNGVFVSPNLNIRRVELNSVSSKVTAACVLENNHFVLGTNNGELLFYNQTEHIKTLELPGKKIIGNLYYDADTHRLIVSINGLESYVVNLTSHKITDVLTRFSVAKSFSKIDANTLFYGNYKEGVIYKNPFTDIQKKVLRSNRVKASIVSNNKLLVAYNDGLLAYDKQTFKSDTLTFNTKNLLVNTLAKTDEAVWLGTQHNGLLVYANHKLSKADIKLPNQFKINELQADGDILWISAEEGLFQYQSKTKQLRSLSAQDGLNTAVNDFLILKDHIVITLPTAFYILPKNNRLFKDFKTAKVRIEGITINDRDTLVKTNYKLPYNYNKVGVRFNSNGFQTNQHVAYQYRIKELDVNWQVIPMNTHYVNFNSLSSGNYTFELKAQNVSAQEAVFAKPITFVITKPFWETWWFFVFVFLGVFGLIWLYFRWRLKQKEHLRIVEIDKILVDNKITNLRLENLRSQMNPHFIFNALNSIQDYIISNEKELASSYLVKFSRLIRMYLEYSQQNEITLQEELKALQLYLELEKVRFEDELEYRVVVDDRLKTKYIKVPSLFIQPYVENALKHGLLHKLTDRKLTVEAKMVQDNKLQITIEDNGIGRAQSEKLKRPNQHHKPFATKANEERVHLYKNKLKRDITIEILDLTNHVNQPIGTKVVILMPIK
ncbi:histidine kinase [Bizionia sp. KMM 8389]